MDASEIILSLARTIFILVLLSRIDTIYKNTKENNELLRSIADYLTKQSQYMQWKEQNQNNQR